MKYAFVMVTALALTLAVPTAAVTLEDDTSNTIVLEASSPYATTENGQLELDFERLNADAVTTVDEAFTVRAIDEDVDHIWLSGTDGVTFYRNGDPGDEITAKSPLEPATGQSIAVGVSIDTHQAGEGTESFTIHVRYDDDEDDETDPDPPTLERVIVSDTEVTVGETITVTGIYRGGSQSMATMVGLTVDDIVVSQKRVFVFGGENRSVSFERTMDAPGTYEVGIDGRTHTVTVTNPEPEPGESVPNMTVTGIDLDRTEVAIGESVSVTATVENTGNATGVRTLEFAVGGFVVETERVELAPGETRQVEFERSFADPGRYALALEGEAVGTVTVIGLPAIAAVTAALPSRSTAALALPIALGVGFVVRRRRT
ncbi:CARDB domain-containing protein [Natronosalvus caseinilyticus]|uniref:CARDB domain-containing protein n=1 Tax=Natronosalvus caseinilyticus TaxID=2953747 RepID=UPI0028A7643E|nr:CARDB domain-containing protein [Natronosalvus caseinilyticus]